MKLFDHNSGVCTINFMLLISHNIVAAKLLPRSYYIAYIKVLFVDQVHNDSNRSFFFSRLRLHYTLWGAFFLSHWIASDQIGRLQNNSYLNSEARWIVLFNLRSYPLKEIAYLCHRASLWLCITHCENQLHIMKTWASFPTYLTHFSMKKENAY